MDEHEVAWPTGMSDQDPASRERPLVFNSQGFLVAILAQNPACCETEQAPELAWSKSDRAPTGMRERPLEVTT
jgi:hypothetical protein